MRKHRLVGAMLGIALVLCGARNVGAAYPEKPIRLIVSFPAGSGPDRQARYAAMKLQERNGQAVVVENRPGGNGIIAAQAVVHAPPDGYTVFFTSNSPVATNAAMFNALPYDPIKDLAPVARLTKSVMTVVVPGGSPIRTVADLVARAKAAPGKLNYGSGSPLYQLATEKFLVAAGVSAAHVPYKGAVQALSDLAGGQIDFAFADYSIVRPHIQSGKLRILAVTGDKRLSMEPSVPTMQESGYRDFVFVTWMAAYVPAKTPPDIVKKLSDDLLAIYALPESARFSKQMDGEIFLAGPAELRRFQLAEIEQAEKIVKAAGIPKQ
ncbi:Bug family tripartite tricarboxylate transporter substrate binding protein [Cupriavidus sp. CP313]